MVESPTSHEHPNMGRAVRSVFEKKIPNPKDPHLKFKSSPLQVERMRASAQHKRDLWRPSIYVHVMDMPLEC